MFSSKLRNMFINILQPLKKEASIWQVLGGGGANYLCNLQNQNCNTFTSIFIEDVNSCITKRKRKKKNNNNKSVS